MKEENKKDSFENKTEKWESIRTSKIFLKMSPLKLQKKKSNDPEKIVFRMISTWNKLE